MLKFPSMAKKNPDMSYSNSCFLNILAAEYLRSPASPCKRPCWHIHGERHTEDRCRLRRLHPAWIVLQDFASLKNQIIDSERNGYGTELSDILHTITAQTAIDAAQLLDRFWDMFIVDA